MKLDVNQVIDADLHLEVGDVTQQVEITASAPLLQTSDSQVGALVEDKQIVDLPLAARDFMQLSLLSPGVVESRDNIRHQSSRGTWQGSFSVHGQSGKYNQYIFDGLVGKEVQHQTNIFAPLIDAIQEIRIQTSNYSAEFGGEAGGHINVVTKAGTNQFHGTLFEFLRNTKFNAREKFADSRAQLNRNTFGGTLGGPIRRDRTFFFGAWDSMRLRQGFTQNTTVPTPEFRRRLLRPPQDRYVERHAHRPLRLGQRSAISEQHHPTGTDQSSWRSFPAGVRPSAESHWTRGNSAPR